MELAWEALRMCCKLERPRNYGERLTDVPLSALRREPKHFARRGGIPSALSSPAGRGKIWSAVISPRGTFLQGLDISWARSSSHGM